MLFDFLCWMYEKVIRSGSKVDSGQTAKVNVRDGKRKLDRNNTQLHDEDAAEQIDPAAGH